MNANLHCSIDGFSRNFRLLQYNVDQAMREEQFEDTKWNNRYSRVTSLINDVDADIVCLQEMRKLPGTISVSQFLSSLSKYQYEIGYRNPSLLAFGQATLYKPEKFYPLQTVKRWLSDTPETVSDTWAINSAGSTGFGYLVLGTQFLSVREGKVVTNAEPFWVFNVHFGLEEDVKTKSCHKLLEIVTKLTNGQKFVICGDFNFFPDRDGNKQRAILTEKLQDLGKGAKTLGGRFVEGTFIGYEHDQFKADLTNMVSRLDHIFGSEGVIGKEPTLYTKTMVPEEPEELTTRQYPSDHLPLRLEVTLL